jgi:hypothetical protein
MEGVTNTLHHTEKTTETKIVKQNQTEILKLKSTMTEMKNSLEGFNNRSDLAEQRIG